jgi:hypothetical protein
MNSLVRTGDDLGQCINNSSCVNIVDVVEKVHRRTRKEGLPTNQKNNKEKCWGTWQSRLHEPLSTWLFEEVPETSTRKSKARFPAMLCRIEATDRSLLFGMHCRREHNFENERVPNRPAV